MRELIPDVLTWSRLSEPHGYDFNGYLVRHSKGNICVDPVDPGADGLDALAREGVAVIALPNRNHVRAANAVRARTGARTLIHPADREYAVGQGAEIDGDLEDGCPLGPLTIVGVPGKSPGEVALHWPQRRALIVGDAIIGNPAGALSLLREKVMDDPAQLRESVRGLCALDFDTLLVGDGTPLLTGARQRALELCDTFPR